MEELILPACIVVVDCMSTVCNSISTFKTCNHCAALQVMEERVSGTNVDIACVAPRYRLYTQQQVEAVIARL